MLGLCEPMGVTRVYKGTTRRRFRDNIQQLETQEKRIRSLVVEAQAIPQQLDRRLLPSPQGAEPV